MRTLTSKSAPWRGRGCESSWIQCHVLFWVDVSVSKRNRFFGPTTRLYQRDRPPVLKTVNFFSKICFSLETSERIIFWSSRTLWLFSFLWNPTHARIFGPWNNCGRDLGRIGPGVSLQTTSMSMVLKCSCPISIQKINSNMFMKCTRQLQWHTLESFQVKMLTPKRSDPSTKKCEYIQTFLRRENVWIHTCMLVVNWMMACCALLMCMCMHVSSELRERMIFITQ